MATLRYKDPVTGQYKDDIHVVGAVSSVNGQTGVVELDVVDRFSCQKIKPFLYEATAVQVDYDYAYDFFLTRNPNTPASGCAAVRIGNEYGRNFDWQYNNQASFALHVPACDGRYASVGIAGSVPGVLDTNESAWDKKIIPFFTQDGINEYGLTVSTLVVPSEGQENRSVPTGTKRDSVNGIMLCRYILDRYKTVDEAIADLTAHVEIWFSDSLHDMNYEQHWLIADAEDTYAIEIVNNAIVAREINALTNFLVNGVTFNDDGTVYTPATLAQGSPTTDNGITAHGSGLERWNVIAQHTTGTMRELLTSLKYTNAYQQDTGWHTEFVGGSLHCDSPVSAFAAAEAEARTAYQSRTRDNPVTWQTVHSAIYNIAERSLAVVVQEDGVEIAVGLDAISERVADLEDTVATQSTAIAQLDGAAIKGVKVAGTELTKAADGTVNVPYASATYSGVVIAHPNIGFRVDSTGYLRHAILTNGQIDAKSSIDFGLVTENIDRAVRAGLLSNAQITDADKPAICDTIGAQTKYTTQTITIAAASWSNNTVTVNVTGVTADNLVQLSPASKADADTWGICGVFCNAQGAGTLTFTCVSTPTSAISMEVVIW